MNLFKGSPMSRIENTGAQIRKKLSLNDVEPSKRNPVKRKVTVYLDDDSYNRFKHICSQQMLRHGKLDRSSLLREAIELLYNERMEHYHLPLEDEELNERACHMNRQ